MNIIIFTFLYILGPEISFARKYLVIDLDAIKQLKLSSHGARRYTDDTIQTQPKDLIKTVLHTLQSYDDDQLNNILNSVKNKLPDLNMNDATFNFAKGYLLNLLSQGKDRPISKIKGLMSFASQILDDDKYADQINSAYTSAVNYFNNELSDSNTDDATVSEAKDPQVSEKLGKDILDIVSVLSQSQGGYDEEKPSLRARRDEQNVGRLLNHSVLRKSRDESKLNLLDQITSALQAFTTFFFTPKEPSRSTDEDLTPEEKELLNKLAQKFQKPDEADSHWQSNLLGQFVNKFPNALGKGENLDKIDWSAMLSSFSDDAKKTDSLRWLKDMLKKFVNNNKVWDSLGQYAKKIKPPAERGHGVNLSFR